MSNQESDSSQFNLDQINQNQQSQQSKGNFSNVNSFREKKKKIAKKQQQRYQQFAYSQQNNNTNKTESREDKKIAQYNKLFEKMEQKNKQKPSNDANAPERVGGNGNLVVSNPKKKMKTEKDKNSAGLENMDLSDSQQSPVSALTIEDDSSTKDKKSIRKENSPIHQENQDKVTFSQAFNSEMKQGNASGATTSNNNTTQQTQGQVQLPSQQNIQQTTQQQLTQQPSLQPSSSSIQQFQSNEQGLSISQSKRVEREALNAQFNLQQKLVFEFMFDYNDNEKQKLDELEQLKGKTFQYAQKPFVINGQEGGIQLISNGLHSNLNSGNISNSNGANNINGNGNAVGGSAVKSKLQKIPKDVHDQTMLILEKIQKKFQEQKNKYSMPFAPAMEEFSQQFIQPKFFEEILKPYKYQKEFHDNQKEYDY